MTNAIDAAALHNAGGEAYINGVAQDDCPYGLSTWSYRYWMEGFQEARSYYPAGSDELAKLQRLYEAA